MNSLDELFKRGENELTYVERWFLNYGIPFNEWNDANWRKGILNIPCCALERWWDEDGLPKYYTELKTYRRYFCDEHRHLVCLPYSIENLHKMADDLGIKRNWFHKDHYDIPKKRVDEIKEKCYIVPTKHIVYIRNSSCFFKK